MQGNRRLIYDLPHRAARAIAATRSTRRRVFASTFSASRANFAIVHAEAAGEMSRRFSSRIAADFCGNREGKDRARSCHRRDRERQNNDAGRAPQRDQATQPVHVVTLEDPIEFVHPTRKATFNQRELGHDFDNYPNGLRAALRQAPKVILVGEMRDRATVEVALMAAETGHLVLSTLHTVDAGQSINRILGLFSLGEEQQLRIRLADSMRYIVSQRLAPKSRRRPPVADAKSWGTICARVKRSRSAKGKIAASTRSSKRVRHLAG